MRPVSYLRLEQARFLTLSDIFCGLIIYLRPNMQINTRPYYVRSDFISASSRGRATKTETRLVCALAADSFIFQKIRSSIRSTRKKATGSLSSKRSQNKDSLSKPKHPDLGGGHKF